MGKITFKKSFLKIAFGIVLLFFQVLEAQSQKTEKTKKTEAAAYCEAGGNSIDFEYIGQFRLGAFLGPNTTSTGYSDHTNLVINLVKGETYLLSIHPAWSNAASFSAGYGVWIDYNGDKAFNYGDEMVWSAFDGSYKKPITSTFKVSENAVTGTTRLRVAMEFAYRPNACGLYKYGEVEDYTVNIIEGVPNNPLAPAAPVSLTASEIIETQFKLSWTLPANNPDVTGYDIYQDQVLIASSAIPSYTVTGLDPKTSYVYTVKTKNANGISSLSSEPIVVTTIPDVTPPTIPGNFTIASLMSRKVNLSWSPATDLVSGNNITYKIYNGNTLVATTKSSNYLITGLKPGTEYSYKLYAYDEANNFSNAVNIIKLTTPVDTTPPTKPTDLTASNITTSSVTLSWTASTDNEEIDSYYISGGPSGLWPKGTQATISNLQEGTTYTFTLNAVDPAGLYSESATITITTVALPKYCASKSTDISKKFINWVTFGTISNNSGVDASGYSDFTAKSAKITKGVKTSISINAWVSPSASGSNRYYVWIDYNGDKDFDDPDELVVKGSTSAAYLNNFITIPGTAITGKTRMRVILKEGTAPTPCETFAIGEVEDYTIEILDSNLGIDEYAKKSEGYILSPNPAHEKLYIDNAANADTAFKIISSNGQIIKEGKIDSKGIDIHKLSNGIYIIELNDGEKSIAKKFIKN